jgi:hypothetical protein
MSTVTLEPAGQANMWFDPRRVGFFLAALIGLAFPLAIVGVKLPLFRDFGLYSYPIAHYLRESVRHGELPLWNPLSFCGLPFLAQWNTMVLYPLSLLYIVLPLAQGLTWFSLLHVWIGGFGMFQLARRWTGSGWAGALAGVVYMLNGVMLDTGLWPCSIGPLAWAPWFVWTAREYWNTGGRSLFPALAAGVMLMLAPFPEIVFMTWLFLAGLWLADQIRDPRERFQRLKRAALLAVLTVGICAAQLMPFLELLSLSQRGQDPTRMLWPMPATGWANLLIPLYLCVPAYHGVYFQPHQSFVSSYYMGIGTMALAAVALGRARDRRAVIALGLFLFSMVMAVGNATPVFEWINRLLPPLRLMRFSIKYVFLLTLTLPVVAAFALKDIERSGADRVAGRRYGVRLAAVAAVVIVIMLVLIGFARNYPMPGHDVRVSALSALSRAAFLLLAVGGILQWMRAPAARKPFWQWMVVMLFAADLLTHKPVRTPWADPWVLEPGILWEHWNFQPRPAHGVSRVMFRPADEIRFGQFVAGAPNDEYVGQRLACSFNCNLLDSLPKVVGFFPLKPASVYEVQRLFNDSPEALLGPLADFLSVAHVNARGKFYEWEARTTALPMLITPSRAHFAPSRKTLAALASEAFNPREEVYLPEEARGVVAESFSGRTRVLEARFRPHQACAVVESEQGALLVWNQTYYPHWHAYVDGKEVQIWQANHAFQAVVIPAGRHEVEWRYVDRTFRKGCVVSVLTLFASVAALMARRPR